MKMNLVEAADKYKRFNIEIVHCLRYLLFDSSSHTAVVLLDFRKNILILLICIVPVSPVYCDAQLVVLPLLFQFVCIRFK